MKQITSYLRYPGPGSYSYLEAALERRSALAFLREAGSLDGRQDAAPGGKTDVGTGLTDTSGEGPSLPGLVRKKGRGGSVGSVRRSIYRGC